MGAPLGAYFDHHHRARLCLDAVGVVGHRLGLMMADGRDCQQFACSLRCCLSLKPAGSRALAGVHVRFETGETGETRPGPSLACAASPPDWRFDDDDDWTRLEGRDISFDRGTANSAGQRGRAETGARRGGDGRRPFPEGWSRPSRPSRHLRRSRPIRPCWASWAVQTEVGAHGES